MQPLTKSEALLAAARCREWPAGHGTDFYLDEERTFG